MSRNFPYIVFAIEVEPRDLFPFWLNVASPLTHVEYGWTLIASNTSNTVGNRIRTTSVADFIITHIWHEPLFGSFKRQICGECLVGGWLTAVTLLENEVETFLGLGLSKCVHWANILSGMIVFSLEQEVPCFGNRVR